VFSENGGVETTQQELVTAHGLALELRPLSAAWLKAEAEAGRIPCLRAGRRLLFNVEAVKAVLLERAATEKAVHAGDLAQ
jgi:hypothetical protein